MTRIITTVIGFISAFCGLFLAKQGYYELASIFALYSILSIANAIDVSQEKIWLTCNIFIILVLVGLAVFALAINYNIMFIVASGLVLVQTCYVIRRTM